MRTQRMQGYILKLIWAISYSANALRDLKNNKDQTVTDI